MLKNNDWIILNAITFKIHCIKSFDDMRIAIMTQMQYLFDFDSASFYIASTFEANKLERPVGIDYKKEDMDDYISRFKDLDYSEGLMFTGKNIAYRESDIVPDEISVNGEYYIKKLAKELGVVIPISFFEKAGNTNFNTVAMIDSKGEVLGTYRKTHIPDGLPYAEKFYFAPGDTGFKVWQTEFGVIGVGICWDQWFPETARSMALQGAELLLYPTAIGTEPVLQIDSMYHWRNAMGGHAAANIMPVIASNRIGTEKDETEMIFYGSSFIADETGQVLAQADRDSEDILVAEFDLDAIAAKRRAWGIYRDRRPEMYGVLNSLENVKRGFSSHE